MTAAAPPTAGQPHVAAPVKIGGALIVLALVAFVGYGIGSTRGTGAHVLAGRAYVGAGVASVEVDGWAYGLTISPGGMQWYDAQGGSHDGGVPPCLRGPAGHYAWLRFGWSTAHGLSGESWRPIDWVQCLTHRP